MMQQDLVERMARERELAGWLGRSVPVAFAEPTGASLSEQLRAVVARHVGEEKTVLAAYRQLRDETTDPVVRTLLAEIVRDEERHHETFERMAAAFESELVPSAGSRSDAYPSAHAPEDGDAATAEVLRDLVQHERQANRQLHRLAHRNRDVHYGLFATLLDAMALDSKKHERIVRFLLDRIEVAR